MPTLDFKGKSVIENYHHTVPHHRLEFDANLSCLPKGEKPSLDGNLIIEGDNLLAQPHFENWNGRAFHGEVGKARTCC